MKKLLFILTVLAFSLTAVAQLTTVTFVQKQTRTAPNQLRIKATGAKNSSASIQVVHVSGTRLGFYIPYRAIVSMGIFTRSDSVLTRTLISADTLEAGWHIKEWKGDNDEGNAVVNAYAGGYVARVIYHDIRDTWEGVLGNTSAEFTGPSVHRGWDGFFGMASTKGKMYYAKGYSEGSPSHIYFQQSDPQRRVVLLPNSKTGMSPYLVCADSSRVYFFGGDAFAKNSFGVVFDATTDLEVPMSAGRAVTCYAGYTYQNAIDYLASDSTIADALLSNATPTGAAVQISGNKLIVARGYMNLLHILDKTTGDSIGTFGVINPRQIAFDSQDKLWMISGIATVAQYTVNDDGTLTPTGLTLPGCESPMALAVSPTTGQIYVSDGGTKQQIRIYSSTGALQAAWGDQGGYLVSSLASTNKFYFNDVAGRFKNTYLAFQPNGSVWVGDVGNYRALHYTASRAYVEQIQYIPRAYSSWVDKKNPKTVTGNWLEFEVDYSKPLAPNNGSWKLVRNHGAKVTSQYQTVGSADNNLLRSIVTFPNGRRYAMLGNKVTALNELIELSDTIRYTGITLGSFDQLYKDGSIRGIARATPPNPQYWTRRDFTGTLSNGDPTFTASYTIATTGPTTAADPLFQGNNIKNRAAEITATGIIPVIRENISGTGIKWFLGGVKVGENRFRFRGARGTPTTYTGDYPAHGEYDRGNQVKGTGIAAMSQGRFITWGYHGEFWKASQTNEYQLVYDNGLFIKRFGTTRYDTDRQGLVIPPAQMAGNAFSGNFIDATPETSDDDVLYYYHNDENYHSGIHRWKLWNLKSLGEIVISIGADFPKVRSIADGTDLLTGLPYGAKMPRTGYGWSASHEQTTAGNQLFVRRQIAANASIIPVNSLTAAIPEGTTYQYTSTTAVSDLLSFTVVGNASIGDTLIQVSGNAAVAGTILKNAKYTMVNTNAFRMSTNVKSANVENPDLSLITRSPTPVERSYERVTGVTSTSLAAWTLQTLLSYEGTTQGESAQGLLWFEVRDNQNRTISRFSPVSTTGKAGYYSVGNGVTFGTSANMIDYIGDAHPLTVSLVKGKLRTKYGDYGYVETTKIDPLAAEGNPAKVVFFMKTKIPGNSYQRSVDLISMLLF